MEFRAFYLPSSSAQSRFELYCLYRLIWYTYLLCCLEPWHYQLSNALTIYSPICYIEPWPFHDWTSYSIYTVCLLNSYNHVFASRAETINHPLYHTAPLPLYYNAAHFLTTAFFYLAWIPAWILRTYTNSTRVKPHYLFCPTNPAR